jgi:hypothetical protein
MNIDVSYLMRLASMMPESKRKKAGYNGPGRIVLADGEWLYAGSGYAAVFVRLDNAQQQDDFPLLDEQIQNDIVAVTSPMPTEVKAMQLVELAAFLGDARWRQKCPACEGTSRTSEHVYCSYCEDADVWPEIRRAWLLGCPFDANKLAQALSAIRQDCPIFVGKTGARKANEKLKHAVPACLWVIHGQFHAVLCCVDIQGLDLQEWSRAPQLLSPVEDEELRHA